MEKIHMASEKPTIPSDNFFTNLLITPVILLRILYVYTPSQKFNKIRISVFCDIIKIWKKSIVLKMSKTYILHNNNVENFLKYSQQK